jgi:pimeloyl-ACP methyl ester carboxylesterase
MPYLEHQRHRLSYREQGCGPLLVILPGNTASSACHDGELAYFGERYHAVALDFWGTGRSDRLPVWPDTWWEQGAHDVAALVTHLGESPAIVVGCSGGAAIALLTAIEHPECVRAVIADSEVERCPAAHLEAALAERAQRTADQVAFWQHAHGTDWEQVVEADTAMVRRFGELGGDYFHGRLGEIRCPVLFTASLSDPALPQVGEQLLNMARQVPDSRAYLHSQGDHPLMWSQAAVFRRVCDSFVLELV